jgi:hypothetical protein
MECILEQQKARGKGSRGQHEEGLLEKWLDGANDTRQQDELNENVCKKLPYTRFFTGCMASYPAKWTHESLRLRLEQQ